jgi:hypothetical protein
MTFKNAAKNTAFAIGMFVFPIKIKESDEKPFDIDEHAAAVQASFRYAVKDHLK